MQETKTPNGKKIVTCADECEMNEVIARFRGYEAACRADNKTPNCKMFVNWTNNTITIEAI